MNFNFFDWVRDGVKRSVLLGVSDAVETIGMPSDEETARNKILHYLQTEEGSLEPQSRPRIANSGGTSTGTRKLGRTIADISK